MTNRILQTSFARSCLKHHRGACGGCLGFSALLLLFACSACQPDLGEVPYKCHKGNKPECPDGYECMAENCVKVGTCPETVPGCGAVDPCGNGTCDPGETPASCPKDCNVCGNGKCDPGETSSSCPKDCKTDTCGNGTCDPGETPTSCAKDCNTCGNGTCDPGEDNTSCEKDCPLDKCGNGTCDPGETNANCKKDCPIDKCGNGTCDAGETNASCPKDCPASTCGDGTCDPGEDEYSCAKDCKAGTCGNGKCDSGEDYNSCPKDCTCGDGTCDFFEDYYSCPEDCTCGNGKCDSSEDYYSCPEDCTCGNGKCDSSETPTNCPEDCACKNGDQKCDGTDTLSVCENTVWKKELCETLCLAGSFDYAVECAYSSTTGKDVCLCGKYVAFGGVCDDRKRCDPSMACAATTSGTKGFCTKYCTQVGSTCPGAPAGTTAKCEFKLGGKDACGFLCTATKDCPLELYCNTYDGICEP